MQNAPESLAAIAALYEADLYLQAYHAFLKHKPLRDAATTDERLMAARLAMQMGDDSLADALRVMAHRKDPENPRAIAARARKIESRDGVLHMWEFLRANEALWRKAEPRYLAPILVQLADCHCSYRDFSGARALLDEARKIRPDHKWIDAAHVRILQDEDRIAEALEASRPLMEDLETGRYATQFAADLLVSLNRDEEAMEILRNKAAQVEYFGIWMQLAALYSEHKRFPEALDCIRKAESMAPLADNRMIRMFAAHKFDICYDLNDFDGAVAEGAHLKSYYYTRITERLKEGKTRHLTRKVLPVGFVRQHHDTCAPATLAAISTFLGKPANHLEIADEICYGGTPYELERRWAVKQGFVVHEFRVTWEATVALINLGLPFTLSTVFMTTGHLQAIIGYDERAGTLIMRDPNTRHETQSLAEEFFEQEASNGPRGMVLAPPHLADQVAALNLPDLALYEHLHNIRTALKAHNRPQAAEHLRQMTELDPAHRLTLYGRRDLANYDVNPLEDLAVVEELQKRYPDDNRLRMQRYHALGRLDRTKEQLAYVAELCARRRPHGVFMQEYADHLASDARESTRAMRIIRRALFCNSLNTGHLHTYARLLWRQRNFDEALLIYYFAATLGQSDEDAASAYFQAARRVGKQADALQFLRRRWDANKTKSGDPAQTLYNALDRVNRPREAMEVVEEAVRLRPDDNSLLRFAADIYARRGDHARADALMAQAEPISHRLAWLRSAAQIARYRSDYEGAIARWREVLELQPMHEGAHDALSDLLERVQGPGSGAAHLIAACRRYPENIALLRQLSDILTGDELSPELRKEGEAVNLRLLELQPNYAWNYRQYALFLCHRKDFARAEAMAKQSLEREPNNPFSHQVYAHVLKRTNRMDEARAELRKAIALDVDMGDSIEALIDWGPTPEDKLRDLDFIHQELMTQVVYGSGLSSYRDAAYPHTVPEDLLSTLRILAKKHADVWESHAGVVMQLRDMGRLDEAAAAGREATERFPLVSNLWTLLASVYIARQEPERALAALNEAMAITPAWGLVSRRIAGIHSMAGNWAEARKVMETAVARAPLSSENHESLAGVLRRLGEKEKAWEHITRAVSANPDNSDAMTVLCELAEELNTPERAIEFARTLAKERPGSAVCWLNLAEILSRPEDEGEFFRAVNKAIDINPRSTQAYDMKAVRLAELELWDEALAACNAPVWEGKPTAPLRGRACWVWAKQGERQRAIDEMGPVLQAFPDYFQGWNWLADWAHKLDKHDIYLEAAKRMVHLDPRHRVAYGYLAAGYLAKEEPEPDKAMDAFETAFGLSPEYVYAANRLIQMQLERGLMGKALATLNRILIHRENTDFARICVVRTAVAASKITDKKLDIDDKTEAGPFEKLPGLAAASRAFKELCPDTDRNNEIREAIDLMLGARYGYAETARTIMRESLSDKETSQAVGYHWAKTWVDTTSRGWMWLHLVAAGKTPAASAGFSALLDRLARHNDMLFVLIIYWWFGKWLAQSGYSWGNMAYALTAGGFHRTAEKWTRDWRRPDARAWAIENRAEALRVLGRYEEASEVSRYCLAPERRDHSARLHFAWLALEEALNGNMEQALKDLEEGTDESFTYYYFTFPRLATGCIFKVYDAAPADRLAAFESARERLRGGWLQLRGKMTRGLTPLINATYTRTLKRMRNIAGLGDGTLATRLADQFPISF
ncbi:hypothetical protein DB346_04525 [Verrucomicrobia bacterium LW23]|nr:hypothetical protein DB346_04525 [Verrucomicrobia bacterium LW23]